MARPPRIHHPTSEPWRFFGRQNEQILLNDSLGGAEPSLVAFVGEGGQGKTAIVQHWLHQLSAQQPSPDGIFLWSFYRGPDGDLCLRNLLAYALGLDQLPEVSASYCVDHLLPIIRKERWAIVLDGTEVVQYDSGPWQGRFFHPELGRFLEEIASEKTPGVTVITSRFVLPTLELRPFSRVISLEILDGDSACGLLSSLGVRGDQKDLEAVAKMAGNHAKAVELLGTYLVRYQDGLAQNHEKLPEFEPIPGANRQENQVARILSLHRQALPVELADMVALTTSFRAPLDVNQLQQYLSSPSITNLLHEQWGRTYLPLVNRSTRWFHDSFEELLRLRLLESVQPGPVIDAHPLVRRAFENALGQEGQSQSALARAGFLRGRPDRRRPDRLEDAGQEIELFHSYCDAGFWNEADNAFRALENPKHRLLAPAREKELLQRFFPNGDLRQKPIWPGFSRHRSLAISLEMLGEYELAIDVYPPQDAPLRGDSLLALGHISPILEQHRIPGPWNNLWQAYRCHALALDGQFEEAGILARSFFPMDIYEWFHVFEALWYSERIHLLDLRSLTLFPGQEEHRWASLARRRMQADHLQIEDPTKDLHQEYEEILDAYERAGLPLERTLTRLRYANHLFRRSKNNKILQVLEPARTLAIKHRLNPMLRQIDDLLASVENS